MLKDISSIQNLERSLCKIWDDVKESLPSNCNGLALETNDKPKPKRKAASHTEENNAARERRKIQQLPKGKYGRPKHHYTGRVGQSAKHEARMNELPGTHIEGKDKLMGILSGSQH